MVRTEIFDGFSNRPLMVPHYRITSVKLAESANGSVSNLSSATSSPSFAVEPAAEPHILIDVASYKYLTTPIFTGFARISQLRWQPSFILF